MVVAESFRGLGVGSQEHPRILDGPAGQYKVLRTNPMGFSLVIFYGYLLYRRNLFICFDIYHVGIGIKMDIISLYDRVFIQISESRKAELPHLVPHYRFIQGERIEIGQLLRPVFKIVFIGTQLQFSMGTGVKRIQILPGYRPPAVGHPVPFYKVDVVKWRAHARPVAGGAPEIMQPARFQRIVLLPGGFALIEILDRIIIIETAPFEQDYFMGSIDPIQSHADTRCSGTHDADIPLDQRIVCYCSCIGVHDDSIG